METEGIKYAGSKLRLLSHILGLAAETGAQTVLDAFAGTTRVSQAFARAGYRVICNDIAPWSKVFADCYLGHDRTRSSFQELIDHLNALSPVDGWITENYGGLDHNGSAIQTDGTK
ncbi:MAG TPA: DNA methyltransferase, partial [Phycisphaerales bacterium]|nr:DNA methyltransferase [Phycisphaerales bacterium]